MSGSTPKTYGSLLAAATQMLGSKFDAGQLFTHVTQKKLYHMSFLSDKPVPEKQADLLLRMVKRRLGGEPLQYLLGEWEFYGLPFKVGKGVLIPRAETESVVDTALDLLKDIKSPVVLDLCSGTGCVAAAISHNRPDALVTAVELSDAAYDYLLLNIELNHSKVMPVKQDIKEYKHPCLLDILVSNPPYIPKETIAALQTEVKFEPRMALSGGGDGLDFYRIIPKLYFGQLLPGGWFCLEIGVGQSDKVVKILKDSGCVDIFVRDDYSGIPRVVCAKKPV
ncbi:MAG: peptide chain release factor N(5)-glutamine methyltransferase [Oscillospiraceae bacterium]|nr:peptide chain release factor N(5)-glutamine methyltransferase [Oscillospiraceae bacterium]